MDYTVKGSLFSEKEQVAALKVKDWVEQLCKSEGIRGDVWISHLEGTVNKETVLFFASLSASLYKIKKAVTAVVVEDVVLLFKQIRIDLETLVV